MSERDSRESRSGSDAAPVCTCATCAHFDRSDDPSSDKGLCAVVLPPRAFPTLSSPKPVYTLADLTCSMHKARPLDQCSRCVFQWELGNEIAGCLHFEGKDEGIAATVLAAVLFQNAKHSPCPAFQPLEFGPDSYRSENLPRPKP